MQVKYLKKFQTKIQVQKMMMMSIILNTCMTMKKTETQLLNKKIGIKIYNLSQAISMMFKTEKI